MSSYDRYDSRRRRPLYGPGPNTRRSTLGYWVPLVLTVTVATAGLVAWIWSERQEGGDEDNDDDEYTNDEHNRSEHPPRLTSDSEHGQAYTGPPGSFEGQPPSYPASASRSATGEDESFFARVSGAVRRSPSPQQFFDSAGQRLAAGVAAAGAAVGLGSIREETRGQEGDGGFSDHERWSEEAETKRVEAQTGAKSTGKDAQSAKARSRRTVAIIVSAESELEDVDREDDVEFRTEHASILSHLPQHFDPSTTRLFVLIYAPHLTSLPTQASSPRGPPSLSSSYSAIATPGQTPGEEQSSMSPDLTASNPPNRLFDALWTQSLTLVDRPSMILPFTTPTGYIHILRHLAPSLVYLSDNETISGPKGDHVAQLRGWVGQTVVVVGDEGHGGLADTDTEDESARPSHRDNWWEGSDLVGLGKGVEVVDAGRVGDDWARRLGGRP